MSVREKKKWKPEKQQNINEIRIDSLKKKTTKSINCQPRKKENTNIKIKNKSVDITINLTELKGIIKGYYQQWYANKFNGLAKMDIFLEKCQLLKVTKGDQKTQTDLQQVKRLNQ